MNCYIACVQFVSFNAFILDVILKLFVYYLYSYDFAKLELYIELKLKLSHHMAKLVSTSENMFNRQWLHSKIKKLVQLKRKTFVHANRINFLTLHRHPFCHICECNHSTIKWNIFRYDKRL